MALLISKSDLFTPSGGFELPNTGVFATIGIRTQELTDRSTDITVRVAYYPSESVSLAGDQPVDVYWLDTMGDKQQLPSIYRQNVDQSTSQQLDYQKLMQGVKAQIEAIIGVGTVVID